MKCFYHRSLDAIALCKNCYKGLCASCAIDLENGQACKNNCESAVQLVGDILKTGREICKIDNKTSNNYSLNKICYAVLGLVIISVVIYISIIFSDAKVFLFGIFSGLVFLLAAYFNYLNEKDMKGITCEER